MTIASIAMIAMNISIDSRLIVSIIMLFMFSGAKIFRIRGRNNRNTIETEKNTPETTKMTSEVSAIVDLSVYRIVLSGQRLLEIAASVKVHPQIYARCHRLFSFRTNSNARLPRVKNALTNTAPSEFFQTRQV